MVQLRALYPEPLETTYTSRTCDCRRSSRPIRHKPALNEPPQHQGDGARLPRRGDRRAERTIILETAGQLPLRIGHVNEGSIACQEASSWFTSRSSASRCLAAFLSQSRLGFAGRACGMGHLLSLRPATAALGPERRRCQRSAEGGLDPLRGPLVA